MAIPVTSDTLEQIAFDTGATINLGGDRPTLQLGDVTFVALATTPAAS